MLPKRDDGSRGLMVIKKGQKNVTTVKVSLKGVVLAANGVTEEPIRRKGIPLLEGQWRLGASILVPIPPYTATVMISGKE
jgi:hypothetical protein